MVKEIEIFQIDAFTNVAFCGNPAGVTFSNNLSETEKQLSLIHISEPTRPY